MTLIYSCKTPGWIIYKQELLELSKSDKFDIVLPCTRMEEKEEWKYPKRRIDKEMIQEYIKDLDNCFFFICGPPKFTEGTEANLKELGVNEEKIEYEKWS